MGTAVVPFRNTVILKGMNSLHLCKICYGLGVWFISALVYNSINRNDMLVLLPDVCFTVPGLMCVMWKVMNESSCH